jgi:hypothetical protein
MRFVVLWACIGLFLLRVLGQLEVVLIAPAWLPPMEQWYSGLLPYPLLLPAQILILMLMTGLTVNEMRRPQPFFARPAGRWNWLRDLSIIYFAVMVLRLVLAFLRGAEDVIAAGGIPVAFHWVLALFLLVLSRDTTSRQHSREWLRVRETLRARAVDRSHRVIERVE